ncbi:hypothetical protein K440DRAFT_332988 [Wilcoxina mikolae CBS 423.85]|nr:hypothetical protein K440DRAFT_332988 [Wilcoxina mikolae CBS 423.85]
MCCRRLLFPPPYRSGPLDQPAKRAPHDHRSDPNRCTRRLTNPPPFTLLKFLAMECWKCIRTILTVSSWCLVSSRCCFSNAISQPACGLPKLSSGRRWKLRRRLG